MSKHTAYEVMFIVDATLAEDAVKATIEKYSSVITKNDGSIDDVDIWEPRKLAYEIKGFREGRYIVVNFQSTAAAKDELDRIFRISDDVIRHMIIKQDPKADRFPSKTRSVEAERVAARVPVAPAPAPQTITDLGTPAVDAEAPAEAPTEESAE